MGQTYKADFEVDNGTDYDKYNFSTSADQVSYTKNGKETNVQTELDALNTGLETNSWYGTTTGITNTAGYPIKSADGQILKADSAEGCYKITLVTAQSGTSGLTSTYTVIASKSTWYMIDAITIGTDNRAPRLKIVSGNTQLAVYTAGAVSSNDVHVFYRVDTIYRVN